MTSRSNIDKAHRTVVRMMQVGVGLLALSTSAVLLSAVWPLAPSLSAPQDKLQPASAPAEAGPGDLDGLLKRLAGRALVRPAQVQAAVKDSGAAAKLAKKLKLQGVVRMGDSWVAYVDVSEQGVKALRKGESVLEFVVKEVEPGKVIVSLEGVEVTLDH